LITGQEDWNGSDGELRVARGFPVSLKLGNPVPLPCVEGAIDTMTLLIPDQTKSGVLTSLEAGVLKQIDNTGVQIPVIKNDSLVSIHLFREISTHHALWSIFLDQTLSKSANLRLSNMTPFKFLMRCPLHQAVSCCP
jgi:hypothetical protein